MVLPTIELREQLITINHQLKSCDSPKQLDTYLIIKFSDEGVKQAVSWPCRNKYTIEKERFFKEDLPHSQE